MNRRQLLKSAALAALATHPGFAMYFAAEGKKESLPAGDWPMWRQNGRMTGYQPMPGAMTAEPAVAAKYFLGASAGAQTAADLNDSTFSTRPCV